MTTELKNFMVDVCDTKIFGQMKEQSLKNRTFAEKGSYKNYVYLRNCIIKEVCSGFIEGPRLVGAIWILQSVFFLPS